MLPLDVQIQYEDKAWENPLIAAASESGQLETDVTVRKSDLLHILWPSLEELQQSAVDVERFLRVMPAEFVYKRGTWPSDHWTGHLVSAIAANEELYSGKNCLEVGVGAGPITAFLVHYAGAKSVTGFDVSTAALESAHANLADEVAAGRVTVAESYLLEQLGADNEIDCVVGCIPQMPLPDGVDIRAGFNFGEYYDVAMVESHLTEANGALETLLEKLHYYDDYSLALNFQLLVQGFRKLRPGATVTLNLAGRPGLPVLQQMFEDAGFSRPAIIRERTLPQAVGTDISKLLQLERKHGMDMEFFAPVGAEEYVQINAAEAQQRLAQDQQVDHKLYAIHAQKAFIW